MTKNDEDGRDGPAKIAGGALFFHDRDICAARLEQCGLVRNSFMPVHNDLWNENE